MAELLDRLNSQSRAVKTVSATVDLEPKTGSAYSGIIKEYHDVQSFILAERPARLRMVGKAPVLRTSIFDMASDRDGFRLYLPTKQKFVVGTADQPGSAQNSLESLRPQHILRALFVPGLEADAEQALRYEDQEQGRRYYVVEVLKTNGTELALTRQAWFDRASLDLVRLRFYGAAGEELEDVGYSHYQEFDGVSYPARIEINCPREELDLTISFKKASLNQPIEAEKFELRKPEGVQLIDLNAQERSEAVHGQ